jgi:cellulose synthase (UDP-forming)
VVNFAALITGIQHWIESPEHRDVIGITLGWCIYNLYVGIMSMGAFWERRQIRRHHRIRVDGVAQVTFPRVGKTVSAEIVDMSLRGMGMTLQPDFDIKEREYITIESADSQGRQFHFEGNIPRAFRRGEKFMCGVELRSEAQDLHKAIGFLYGDSERWMRAWESRFNSRGMLKLTGVLLRLGIRATIITIPVLLRETVVGVFRMVQFFAQMARKGWVAR